MKPTDEKFGALFNKLALPVVVCRPEEGFPVHFLNASARLIFTPNLSVQRLRGIEEIGRLGEVVRFERRGQFDAFSKSLRDSGEGECLRAGLRSHRDEPLAARVNGARGVLEGEPFFFIYIEPLEEADAPDAEAFGADVLGASQRINDVEEAISAILAMAGEHAKVCRSYVFEIVPPGVTRNTYEWCAPGVESALEYLQNLNEADYDFEAIMNSAGMLIAEDVSLLPERDRVILDKQGIKAMAILPLYHSDRPLGYVGFDDCDGPRRWSLGEIRVLRDIAGTVSSLIHRRNAEREAMRSLEIVQTVTDNLDDLVYVSDLDTHVLKFVSKSLSRTMNRSQDDILGKRCWEVLHNNQSKPCAFCPIPKLLERRANNEEGSYVWELHNDVTGKWFIVKDSVVRWIDGSQAHLGTFVDITYRKQYEEQLKRFAATDAMTDVFNRKWGYGKLEELYRSPPEQRGDATLCFADLDGLKAVNDHLGHAAGDNMIVSAIQAILACTRREDFVCRWGGDEFILLLRCNLRDARRVIEKIQFAVDHFNGARNKAYTLSISFGLVDFSQESASLNDLIEEADRRMYADKMLKRGGPRIFPR